MVSVRHNAVVVNSGTDFGVVIIEGTVEEKATEFKKTLGGPQAYAFYKPANAEFCYQFQCLCLLPQKSTTHKLKDSQQLQ